MIDPKYFRTDIQEAAKQLARRGFALDIQAITSLENERKELQIQTQQLQNDRNQFAKKIGQAKAQGQEVASLLKEGEGLNTKLNEHSQKLEEIQEKLREYYLNVPNFLDDSVPEGVSEEENQEVRRWGEPKTFNFKPKDHVDLGEPRGWLDFDSASKLTQARFVVIKGHLAKLHRALIQFMLDVHVKEHGYEEVYVPYIVNEASLYGTAQLPKFRDDQFQLKWDHPLFLIPTAEVPVSNLARDEILEADELPKKYVSHTPCFRSESGSYGKDTRGMLRQHQFEKVELVQFVKPDDSERAHEELTQHAEKILQRLELPYRVMLLCSGDTGFASRKTYDLEVWLPGQNRYREISSCSQYGDFQARRMQARWRNPATGKPELLHTINGSGLPGGRTLIAIMENYQDSEGNIQIPNVLLPYMNGVKVLS